MAAKENILISLMQDMVGMMLYWGMGLRAPAWPAWTAGFQLNGGIEDRQY